MYAYTRWFTEVSCPICHSSQIPSTRAYRKWSSSAAAVLAKSRRVEVDQLPGDAESLLATTMADGLTIRPLYTRKDETVGPGFRASTRSSGAPIAS